MATTPPTDPDPRTGADDDEDATDPRQTDRGVSTEAPAEGGDDTAPAQPGSPQG